MENITKSNIPDDIKAHFDFHDSFVLAAIKEIDDYWLYIGAAEMDSAFAVGKYVYGGRAGTLLKKQNYEDIGDVSVRAQYYLCKPAEEMKLRRIFEVFQEQIFLAVLLRACQFSLSIFATISKYF